MTSLEQALEIALSAHKGQTDKAGKAYILHTLRLMHQFPNNEAAQMTALLHDVVEDSDWTFDQLRQKGIPEKVLSALDCLTHRPKETYDSYIQRILPNPLARKVKIADLEDNMRITRMLELKAKDLERLKKYHRVWRKLTEVESMG